MYRETVKPQYTKSFIDAVLASLFTLPADPILDPDNTLRLFTAGPSPLTPNSGVGDFTQATFDGYAGAIITPLAGAPITLPSGEGDGKITINSLFVCTGPATPNTILGYYIQNTALGFFMAEYFDEPVSIIGPGDFVEIAITFPIGWLIGVQ